MLTIKFVAAIIVIAKILRGGGTEHLFFSCDSWMHWKALLMSANSSLCTILNLQKKSFM